MGVESRGSLADVFRSWRMFVASVFMPTLYGPRESSHVQRLASFWGLLMGAVPNLWML